MAAASISNLIFQLEFIVMEESCGKPTREYHACSQRIWFNMILQFKDARLRIMLTLISVEWIFKSKKRRTSTLAELRLRRSDEPPPSLASETVALYITSDPLIMNLRWGSMS